MGGDPADKPKPPAAAPKRGRPPKNTQRAVTVASSTSSAHSTHSQRIVTNQDTLEPPTTIKGKKASKNTKDTTIVVAPARPKHVVQSCSASATIPSGTTSKTAAGEEQVEEGSAEERRPHHKAAEAVNMLLDQANINDSMDSDDIYHEIKDDEGNPIYRGPLNDEHEDEFEMSSDESDVEDGFDSDSRSAWIPKEPIIQPKKSTKTGSHITSSRITVKPAKGVVVQEEEDGKFPIVYEWFVF